MDRLLLLAACLAATTTLLRAEDLPLVIAHRGQGVNRPENPYPENTLPAFEAGFAAGADMIELDVQLDRDGLAIVWHDATVEVGGRKFRVEELRHAEFPILRGPTGIEAPVPTFVEALRLAKRLGRIPRPIDIELKVDGPGESAPLVAEVVRVLRAEHMEDRALLKSFDEASVVALERALPGAETGFLTDTPHQAWEVVERLDRAGEVHVEWAIPGRKFNPTKLTHRGLVQRAHAAGVKVAVWTVNLRWQAWLFLRAGADGIITDEPELLRSMVGAPPAD